MTRKKIRTTLTALSLILLGLTAATAQQEISDPIENGQLVDILPLDGEVFHVQGVDLDSRHIWITSVDRASRKGYLHEFDRHTGKAVRRLELTDGVRYHPGGFSLHGTSLWVAVAEMRPTAQPRSKRSTRAPCRSAAGSMLPIISAASRSRATPSSRAIGTAGCSAFSI